jgi:arylsulfatase A-like enzyme
MLSRKGYVTSGFVANTMFCSYESGLDRGFAHFEDYSVSPGELFRSLAFIRRPMLEFFPLRQLVGHYDLLGRKTAARINQDFLSWLDRQPRRPFFAFLNYLDAHDPYLPPPPFANLGPATTAEYRLLCHWWVMDKHELPPEKIEEARKAYEGCIAYLDYQLGLLMESLRDRGVLANTLIIITSDHGEMFGEHGLFCHGHCLYRPVVQVPLLISYPTRVPSGLEVSQPVSLRDIPATVTDLLGLDAGGFFPGNSLSRFWEKGKSFDAAQDIILSEIDAPPPVVPPDHGRSPVVAGPMKSLILDGKQYIQNSGNGQEELYDFAEDPEELVDLSSDPGNEQVLQHFRQSMARIVSEDRDRGPGTGD